jgi:hypothetical protein
MNPKDVIAYEICNSWWAPWISNDWLQDKIAAYFARKVSRKLARYGRHLKFKMEKQTSGAVNLDES